jgi:hypothetical protein
VPDIDIYGSEQPDVILKYSVVGRRVRRQHSTRRGQGEQVIPATGAFINLQGGKPITEFLQGQLEIAEAGCLISDREYQTGIPGVFSPSRSGRILGSPVRPGRMVAPILDNIANEQAGKLVIAKVNPDENPKFAMEYGVQGIPTMLYISNVERFQGPGNAC